MVVIFLINRGCDNHIIIILVNYFAVKNNCWLYMYKKKLVRYDNEYIYKNFQGSVEAFKIENYKFVLVNPRIKTWYVLNDR